MGRGIAGPPAIHQGPPATLAIALDPEASGLAITAEGAGGQRKIAVLQEAADQTLTDSLGVAGVGDALAVGFWEHFTPRGRGAS
jgi:hypothetical protein